MDLDREAAGPQGDGGSPIRTRSRCPPPAGPRAAAAARTGPAGSAPGCRARGPAGPERGERRGRARERCPKDRRRRARLGDRWLRAREACRGRGLPGPAGTGRRRGWGTGRTRRSRAGPWPRGCSGDARGTGARLHTGRLPCSAGDPCSGQMRPCQPSSARALVPVAQPPSTRPRRTAMASTSSLECAPSLAERLATWFRTVCTLIVSCWPMSAFERPLASRSRISRSRSVSLGRGSALPVQAGEEPGEQLGADDRLALRRRPHAVDDVVETLGLGDEPGGTGFHGGDEDAVGRRGGQDDDLRRGPDRVQVRDRTDPVTVGEAVVEEDDVRGRRPDQALGLAEGRGLAHDEQVRLRAQGMRQAGREHLVVVHHQDPDGVPSRPVWSIGPGHRPSLTRPGRGIPVSRQGAFALGRWILCIRTSGAECANVLLCRPPPAVRSPSSSRTTTSGSAPRSPALLDQEPDFRVLGRATDGDDAFAVARDQRPALVITDVRRCPGEARSWCVGSWPCRTVPSWSAVQLSRTPRRGPGCWPPADRPTCSREGSPVISPVCCAGACWVELVVAVPGAPGVVRRLLAG